MKKILTATFLIIISSVFAIAQTSDKVAETVEKETVAENKIETDKKVVAQSEIEIEKNTLIEDEKVENEITKSEVKTPETTENKALMSRQNTDSYRKNEFFVGYSYQSVDNDFRRDGLNGVNASYVRNVSRYFGVKADVSAAYRSDSLNPGFVIYPDIIIYSNTSTKFTESRYNVLGGIQLKDNASESSFRPFAHALLGVGINRVTATNECRGENCPIPFDFKDTRTYLTGAFGGGIDIKINDKFDFRAIQVDYNPQLVDRNVTRNFRFGIGIVIK